MEFKTQTLEQAYALTGRTPFEMPAIPGLSDADLKQMKANFDWEVCVEAINKEDNEGEKWLPNFGNRYETKYELYVQIRKDNTDKSILYYSVRGFHAACTMTHVGSKRCFKSIYGARYCINMFEQQYIDAHNSKL